MYPQFDIFEKKQNGGLLWRCAEETIEGAKAKAETLANCSEHEHVIVCRGTENCITVKPWIGAEAVQSKKS